MASYWDIKANLTCLSCLLSRGGRREYIASLHPRTSVRGEEPHTTRGDPVYAEHSGSKGEILEKQSPNLRCGCRAYEMNGSGLVCRKWPLWETWRPPCMYVALPGMGALLDGHLCSNSIIITMENKASALDSSLDFGGYGPAHRSRLQPARGSLNDELERNNLDATDALRDRARN